MFNIYDMVVSIPGVLIAISFHEFAHAYVAKLMGDDTAERDGRLTVNPVSHMDLWGTAMLIIAGFGWAKPVPINENRFKNKRLGILMVSLAGVAMNIILATIFFIVYVLLLELGILENNSTLIDIIHYAALINLGFAAFNILPIPPLDGFKVLLSFANSDLRYKAYEYERYGMIVLMVLIITGGIDFILNPVVRLIANFIIDLSFYVVGLII